MYEDHAAEPWYLMENDFSKWQLWLCVVSFCGRDVSDGRGFEVPIEVWESQLEILIFVCYESHPQCLSSNLPAPMDSILLDTYTGQDHQIVLHRGRNELFGDQHFDVLDVAPQAVVALHCRQIDRANDQKPVLLFLESNVLQVQLKYWAGIDEMVDDQGACMRQCLLSVSGAMNDKARKLGT